MQKFMQFVMNHLALWAALAVLVVALVVLEVQKWLTSGKGLEAQEAVNLINREHAVVVDVRSPELFQDGHIVNSINLPAENLKNNFENNIKKIASYKEKNLILVDANGADAASLSNKIKEAGFSKINILNGGIGAWQNVGLPLTKK